jgi:gluconate kinase
MSPFPETNDPKVLIIVFGLPGAGKTYVGRILQECFGFFFYDGDNDLPDRMRAAIAAQAPIDDAMRDVFFARIILSIRRLQPEHNRLVVGQTCIKEKYRRQAAAILEKWFPED